MCYELRLFFFTSGDRRPAASLSTPRWPDGGETTQPQQPRRGFISSTDQLGHGATTFDGPLVSSIPASGFFFFIFKKIKISKIYVRFEIFQKYTPGRPPIGRQAQCVIFFSNLQRSPWRKKNKPCRPLGGRQAPFFFSDFYFCRDLF